MNIGFGSVISAFLPLITLLAIQTNFFSIFISRSNWFDEYDYIVVGAGSAGAVVAARLSEDPTVKVLLLEAGGTENIISSIPLAAANLQKTPLDWQYETEPQENSCFGLQGNRSSWPRGNVVGGSSVLNYMLYFRGAPSDYNRWASLGNAGWGYDDIIQYFKKAEGNTDPAVIAENPSEHSTTGPLTVSTSNSLTQIGQVFPLAGTQMNPPYPAKLDLNGRNITGFGNPQGTTRGGSRCSTARAYLAPVLSRPNLHILTFSYVTKVLFNEAKEAYGVEFLRKNTSTTHQVRATREVILSGGSINSAQLLLLSGVGPQSDLTQLGIPVIANRNVGGNLQDHIYPGSHFTLTAPVSLIQSRVVSTANILRYFATGTGPLTTLGGVEGIAFVNSQYAPASGDWPDFQIHMVSGSPTSDGGQTFRRVQGISDDLWDRYYAKYLNNDTMSCYPVLLRPQSRGYIKLRSTSPFDKPIIQPNYLSDVQDIRVLVEAMQFCRAMAATPAYQQLGAKRFDVMPQCEQFIGNQTAVDQCELQHYTSTIYHPVGTAKMGPANDPTAVVDNQLRVYDVTKLRVIDGSIMPYVVSGNTNAPIIMIGEKGADMIKSCWQNPQANCWTI